MQQQIKRTIALALSLVLCTSSIPTSVLAESTTASDGSPTISEESAASFTEGRPSATSDEESVQLIDGTPTDTGTVDPEDGVERTDGEAAVESTISELSDNSDAAYEGDTAIEESVEASENEEDIASADANEEILEPDEDAIEVEESSKSEVSELEAIEPAEQDDKKADTKDVRPTTKGLEAQASNPSIEYQTHVQSIGWQGWVKNGALTGTSGRALRLEAMRIRLKNASGSVVYNTHAQTYGWLDEVKNGAASGTTGQSKRLEAVRIHLTGAIAQTHDVWYRAHVQTYGWQSWVKNGATAGTSGQSKRVEALEILLIKKGDAIPTSQGSSYTPTPTPSTPSLYYQTHVQTYGWQAEVSNGKTAGTSGESKRLEALRIALRGIDGGVTYRTHVQTYGWQSWRSNGALAGTSGESKRLEGLQVKLTEAAAASYDVWYRCHIQSVGWMGWAKNGAYAGSEGYGLRMEAIQIKLLPKDSAMPGAPSAATDAPYLAAPTVSYRAQLSGNSWQETRKDGATAGATGTSTRISELKASLSGKMDGGIQYAVCSNAGSWQEWLSDGAVAGAATKNITALRMKLTGDVSELFDVWYRVHIAHQGWLDWTRNGSAAGSDTSTCPIEAFEVQVLRKGSGAPGATKGPYYYTRRLSGVDISGWNEGIDIANTEAQFFIIKATEGVSTSGKPATRFNPWYTTWANKALGTDRLIGFYHYANGGDAIKEADEFYDAIKAYKGRAIACLDWESDGNKLFGTGMDIVWCKKFLDRLQSKFGGTPFLYISKSYTNAYNWSSVAKTYPLWGAQYPDYKDVNGYQWNPWQSSDPWGAWGTRPTIFQYTATGVLEDNGGIRYFDFNLFYGSKTDWTFYQQ